MKKNNKKGFTLVELVIVVAVMAVLVAVAIPTIGSIKGSAEDSVAKSNAKTIESIVKLADAEGDGTGSVAASVIAQAVYEAKLGITKDSKPNKYYYNPTTAVVTNDSSKAGSEAWSIEFSNYQPNDPDLGTAVDGVVVTPTKEESGSYVADTANAAYYPAKKS